jgi:imidazole glycerol phosphate synthase glutamine amidotransferase subunit
MIAILDYGAGNLRSVQNTLEEIGAEFTLVRDAHSVRAARKLILPGVGHFGQMMRALAQLDLLGALKDRIAEGAPFLGICLGMQALFEWSEEAPELPGLGIFPGVVRRFPAHARVPHMGWNELETRGPASLFRGLGASPYVYFAHSYYAPPGDYASALCEYDVGFTAALESGNVYGVQFHPEKSGPTGLHVVKNFVTC